MLLLLLLLLRFKLIQMQSIENPYIACWIRYFNCQPTTHLNTKYFGQSRHNTLQLNIFCRLLFNATRIIQCLFDCNINEFDFCRIVYFFNLNLRFVRKSVYQTRTYEFKQVFKIELHFAHSTLYASHHLSCWSTIWLIQCHFF